jgi:hypothetical protein
VTTPLSYDKAMPSEHATYWKQAVNNEMESLARHDTWIYKDQQIVPKGINVITSK